MDSATTSPLDPVFATLPAAMLCALDSAGIVQIEGADAAAFLQGQLSNDVRALGPGTWQHTTLNSPKGRMLANLVLWAEADGYRALLPAELAAPIRKRLAMYVLRSKATVTDETAAWQAWGVAGPAAASLLHERLGLEAEGHRVGANGSARLLQIAPACLMLLAPRQDAARITDALAQVSTVTPEVWDRLMIRAGIPTITAATQDQFVLQTTNLDALDGVSFDKGCYTGQEIIARTQYLGRLKERLFPWHAEDASVIPGTRLYSGVFGEQACGTVVNAAPAPDGGADLLAVVQTAAVDAGDVRLGSPEGPLLQRLPLPYALPQPVPHARPKL